MYIPNNHGTITGPTYVQLLNAIQKTCIDSNIPIENEEQFDECLKSSKALESFSKLSIQDVLKRVSEFVKSNLVLYGAAKNFGLSQLANVFIKQWTSQIEQKIDNKITNLGLRTEEVGVKLQKIMSKEQWPAFDQPLEAEKMLMESLKKPLAQEIVFKHFHSKEPQEMPLHVLPFMSHLGKDADYDYLIETYSPLMNEISFGDTMKNVTDDKVCAYIKRFQWAKIIDLTDCLLLTKKCLNDGHSNVEKIILTGSAIQESDLRKDKFPKLESVIQNKFVNVIKIENNRLFERNDTWKEFKDMFEKADVLMGENIDYYLIDKFEKNPSWEGVETLLCYEQHRGKNRDIVNNNFSFRTTKAFISYLSKETDWNNSNSLGVKLLHLLWDMTQHEQGNKESKQIANEYFFSSLSVTEVYEEKTKTNQTEKVRRASCFQKNDVKRIRTLLRILQSKEITFSDDLIKALSKNLKELYSTLFQKTSCSLFTFSDMNDPRDDTVALIEFLNEIYLVMSHQMESKSWVKSALMLDNPHKFEIHKKPFSSDAEAKGVTDLFLNVLFGVKILKPGPLFSEPSDHSLACMFAQKMPKKSREEVLQQILVTFSDYQSTKPFYPLPKVVLGVVNDIDIPEWDKDSFVCSYLKKYKGVFSEEISEELKEAYWKALLDGKLGGTTKDLIDGLRDYYLLDTTCEDKKKDILDTLWKIGKFLLQGPISGINYHRLNTGEVSEYAREAYEMLTSSK